MRSSHLLSAAVLIAVGCSDGTSSSDGDRLAHGEENTDVGGQVELFSWWTSGGEQDALTALLEVHEARVPDAVVRNAAVEFFDKAKDQLADRLQDGNPPDTYQALVGADLLESVLVNGHDASDARVESIQDMAEAFGWVDVMANEVLEAASHDGKLYAVPVNVQRLNTLYYNKSLLEEFDLTPPETLEDLTRFCEQVATTPAIQEASPTGKMSCLGLGNKWNWTLSQFVFETVFPAVAGPEFYESYFLGNEAADAPEIIEALDYSLNLYCGGDLKKNCAKDGWFNPDVDDIIWDEGTKKLSDGSAMLVAMGDWAKGFFESAPGGTLTANVDFGVQEFPGSQGVFVFASDSFPLCKGAPNRDGARSLLRTMGSVEGQIAFNRKKGSIPARTDIDPSEFDDVTAQAMRDFEDATRARALSALMPAELQPLLSAELKASFQDGSTEIILSFLRANYRSF